MPDIKLFKDNTVAEPDHVIETRCFPGPPPAIIHVAQTNTYYVFAHMIAGSGGDIAYFEADIMEINFAIPAFGRKS